MVKSSDFDNQHYSVSRCEFCMQSKDFWVTCLNWDEKCQERVEHPCEENHVLKLSDTTNKLKSHQFCKCNDFEIHKSHVWVNYVSHTIF